MRQALEMALDWIKKQPEETPESKYDVDTRYVVIREIEAALAQPEQDWIERERAVGYREGHQNALKQMAQPERSMKVEGPLHVVCQCNKCNTQPDNQGKIQTVDSLTERKAD